MKNLSLAKTLSLGLLLATGAARAQTAADSGWRPLFNGNNFNGLYVYAVGTGVVNIAADSSVVKIGTQTTPMFRVDSGRIRVGGSPNGYIGTILQYSHYHVRVQYMWPTTTSATANAGLLIHLDSAQVRSSSFSKSNNRPRSIEVNMKRDANHPWSLWGASSLGPYISTKVTAVPASNAQGQYNPAGVAWTNDPWGSGDNRVISGDLQPNPEKPLGQWNTGEAILRGDSGVFILNGQVRTVGWNFQVRQNSGSAMPRLTCVSGNIGLQSEGAAIWYRNFEIQELDSVTGLPIHATTAVKSGLARSARRPGAWIAHDGGPTRILFPEGASRAELYNLRGRRVAVVNGDGAREVPAGTEKGLLLARFSP